MRDTLTTGSAAERERLSKLPYVQINPHPDLHGVLLADRIREYAELFALVSPFTEEQLKPAGYELSVGDEYCLEGERLTLGSGEAIEIRPFQVVIIKTAETVNLPAFLIARWNIRVRFAYEGLLWVGGPQVDPGYVGHLFCPIYNLSDKPIRVARRAAIAVIDFVTTTPVPHDEDGGPNPHPYPRPPTRASLRDYPGLQSALTSQVIGRLADVEKDTARIRERVDSFVGVVFTVMGLLIAVLALLHSAELRVPRDLVFILGLGVSSASALMVILLLTRERWLKSAPGRIAAFLLCLILIVLLVLLNHVNTPRSDDLTPGSVSYRADSTGVSVTAPGASAGPGKVAAPQALRH